MDLNAILNLLVELSERTYELASKIEFDKLKQDAFKIAEDMEDTIEELKKLKAKK